ncbi:dihydropteroate synthase [Amycolatopsis sp. AA4]|uniref:dihydropteroate synthase n=1 Tax=Actinomycetes TaxID=1760 RepID=UPI0001B535C4|nr:MULTISPECIES: dihydropteroate synthase [Actinomycetes]ATY15408.1 dihydropteroate synthase [Amycolatopsis sp. AA4]EFL11662.1 dihydropteroate synthase [Streptomyces sp. AA4]
MVYPLALSGESGHRPRLVGIVNVTADSFSDGGRFLAPENALAQARRLLAAGADVVELGPAASHPSAEPVTADEEVRRLDLVLDQLVAEDIPVSVDSFQPQTHVFAAARGAMFLNDIHGFPDPERYAELADTGCRLVVMHSVRRQEPATDPRAVLTALERFFDQRLAALQAAGIDRERLIIDPGLGYFLGTTPEPSLAVLSALRTIQARFGVPVMVSPSRKSFLRAITGRALAEIGPASLAAELYAASHRVDFIRTHDVAALRDALTVLAALDQYPGASR